MKDCTDFCMHTKDTRCCVDCSNECKDRCELAPYGAKQPSICSAEELYGMERKIQYAEKEIK